jgi:hypothetical protein
MRRRIVVRSVVFAALFWLGLSLPVLAQGGVGTISGTVTDASGAVLPGATLTLSAPGVIGSGQTVVSDGQGVYLFSRLIPGKYSVKAELSGFRAVVLDGIEVNADRNTRADTKLVVGEMAETVTVSGEAPLLDTTSALQQTTLSRQVLDTVPTGNDVWSIARLAPAVQQTNIDVGGRAMPDQGTMLVHGSIAREQGYMYDGIDVTSPQENALEIRLDTFSTTEISVQAGQTGAESSKGGVLMNLITKTGTNKISGSGVFQGSNHSLEGDNISGNAALKAQLLAGVPAKALAANPNIVPGANTPRLFDSGFTLGGPIAKDKLWFFGSARLNEVYRYQVGSYNSDGTQLLDDNTMPTVLGKVSWAMGPSSQLHVLINWNRKLRAHQNGATITQFSEERATGFNDSRVWINTDRWTKVLSSKAFLDVAGLIMTSHNDKGPQPEVKPGDVARFDSVTNTVSVATGTYSLPTWSYKDLIQASLTYVAGSHDLKIGEQFTRAIRNQNFLSTSDYPAGLQAIYANGVPTSVKTFNTPTGSIWTNFETDIYLQDKWRISNKLTANLGVRFEHDFERVNDGKSPLCQVATPYIAGQCFPAISGVPNLNYFAPRLAAIYDLFGDGKTALKFSYNRYIMQEIGNSALVNPIKVTNDTRPWTVCKAGQTSGCDLNGDLLPQLNELGPSTGFNLGTTNRFADNLKVPHTDEIAAEIEQQLGSQIVFSAGYHYRARHDILGPTNLKVPTSGYTPVVVTEANSLQQVTVYNQDPTTKAQFDVLYANHPEYDDWYHGVDLVIQKRMANHWMLLGSASLDKSEGDIYTVAGINTADANNPNFLNRRGPQIGDVPRSFKLAGAYELPMGIRAAANAVYIAGVPEQTTVLVDAKTTAVKLTQTSQVLVVQPFGTTHTSNTTMVDLNVAKTFRVNGVKIEPRMDIFNATNAGVVTQRLTQLGPSYNNPLTILGARLIKFGVNVTF